MDNRGLPPQTSNFYCLPGRAGGTLIGFAGSDSGGERAASIYTLIMTARLNGLNPEAYLKDILTKIAEGHPINRIDELMPWRMISVAKPQPP